MGAQGPGESFRGAARRGGGHNPAAHEMPRPAPSWPGRTGVSKMAVISMKSLLEAGVHFGHQTKRWNPKMRPYIFGARSGIYIVDLQKTASLFDDAYHFVNKLASKGEKVLFVGTKKQAADIVKEEAERAGMYFVNNRWLGGTLTNFKTVKGSIEKLKRFKEILADEKSSAQYPK